jgi:transposase
LSQVIVSKYSDHCPLYRMEDIFSRHGVNLSRLRRGLFNLST